MDIIYGRAIIITTHSFHMLSTTQLPNKQHNKLTFIYTVWNTNKAGCRISISVQSQFSDSLLKDKVHC